MTEGECIYKILLLGYDSTGKTCFLSRYINRIYNESFLTTIGFDYKVKSKILKNGKNIKLQIWDTAGKDRFRAMSKNFYKGSHGMILIYDVTSRETFENIKKWVSIIREEADQNVIIYLVANKIDMEEKRKVKKEEGEKLAKELGLPFMETSAKSGINVNEIFEDLFERIYKTYGDNSKSAIKLPLYKAKSKENC